MLEFSESLTLARQHFDACPPRYDDGLKALKPILQSLAAARGGAQHPAFCQALELIKDTADKMYADWYRAKKKYKLPAEAFALSQAWLIATGHAKIKASKRYWGFAYMLKIDRTTMPWRYGMNFHFPYLLTLVNEAREAGLKMQRYRPHFVSRIMVESHFRDYSNVIPAVESYVTTMRLAGITDFTDVAKVLLQQIPNIWSASPKIGDREYVRVHDIAAYGALVARLAPEGSDLRRQGLLEVFKAARASFGTRSIRVNTGPRMVMHARAAEGVETPLVLENCVISEQLSVDGNDNDMFAIARRTHKGMSILWLKNNGDSIEKFNRRFDEHSADIKDERTRAVIKQRKERFIAAVMAADVHWKAQLKAGVPVQSSPSAPAPDFETYVAAQIKRLAPPPAPAA